MRKSRQVQLILCTVLVLVSMGRTQWLRSGTSEAGLRVRDRAALDLPILFEQNRGQASSEARYLFRGPGDTLLLTRTGLVWAFFQTGAVPVAGDSGSVDAVRMDLVGSNLLVEPSGEEKASSQVSYLRGENSAEWLSAVPTYHRVRYTDVYPGVDLVFYGRRKQLEYDLVVSPGADPKLIRWRIEGGESVHIDAEGGLVITTASGRVRQLPPRIFQEAEDTQSEVGGRYEMYDDGTFGFSIDAYDSALPLTIDPVLVYSTYLGGSKSEVPGGVAVDAEGNVYLAGNTGSLDFPLRHPFQAEFAGGGSPSGDVFVTKIDASGEYIIYSTYVGGGGTDIGAGIAVDSQQRPVVTGTTFSGDFPVTPGSFQDSCGGLCAFVFRLAEDGSGFSYSALVGRGNGKGVVVDGADQATITGNTSDSDFPTTNNAFQKVRQGQWEGFVSKLNVAGSALVYSTYLGGSQDDNIIGKHDLAYDAAGNLYVVGRTRSPDFPTKAAAQGSMGGEEDAFVAKFDTQGGLIFSTFLGGALADEGRGVAVDSAGNAYVVGNTRSQDFPLEKPFQANFGGPSPGIGDAFVAKVAPDGGLLFSTYLGGQSGDTANDVAVDALDRAVVVGSGGSNFPVQHPLRDFDGLDNYVAKFTQDGSGLVYSTPIGAADPDVFVTTSGTDVLVTGNISSGNYPILNPFQPRSAGFTEVFLTHLADMGSLYFAHFGNGAASGVSLDSDLLLTGSSTETAANATVTIRGDDGELLPLNLEVSDAGNGSVVLQEVTSQLEVVVPPLGAVRIRTDGMGDVVTGSVTVDFDGPIGGVIRFTISGVGTTGVGDSKLVRGFISPVRKKAINTGVALYNTEDKQIGIRARLRNLAGEEVAGGLTTFALQPHQHLAKFIDELFLNADLVDFEGTITIEVTSLNALIVATALELGGQPGQFTTLPVTPVP